MTVLLQDRLDPAGADNEVPRHPVVVPEGYADHPIVCHEYFDVGTATDMPVDQQAGATPPSAAVGTA